MRISDWSSDVCSSDLAALEPFLDVRRIGVLTRGLDVDELQLAIEQRADALQYVVHLRFEHEHDRAVREIGVWPVQHEQVREATDADALVRFGAIAPGIVEIKAVEAADLHRRQQIGGMETGDRKSAGRERVCQYV